LAAGGGDRVDVLLTSYNRSNYLVEALESAIGQTWANLRIIVVDDASPDGAGAVAARYADENPGRVEVIRKPTRRGLTDSMSQGLSLMRDAPYVAFLADDDLWHPTKVERQVDEFARNPGLGLVATEAKLIDAVGRSSGGRFSDVCGLPDLQSPAAKIFTGGNFLCASSVMLSQSALQLVDYGYPLAGTCNDMYWALVVSASMPVGWIEEPLTSYRASPTSISIIRDAEVRRESYALRRYAYRRFDTVRAAVGGESSKQVLERQAISHVFWYLNRKNPREAYRWARDAVAEARAANAGTGFFVLLAQVLIAAVPRVMRNVVGRG
jgi:glycosyltransferase involved in cell wall biosynthesis